LYKNLDQEEQKLSEQKHLSWISDKDWSKIVDQSVFNESAKVKYNLDKIGHSGEYYQTPNYYEMLKICMRQISLVPESDILELGAGVGAFSTIICKEFPKAKISSLDFSKGLVTEVMPAVYKYMGVNDNLIQRIHGSFDDLKLDDNSIDLIIQYLRH
jgi:hypothetical protein